MHDPLVVAFEIRRPWPRRDAQPPLRGAGRFEWQRHGPWWKPGSWSPFVTAFGRRWYFPELLTVWHVEPGGHDSGEVCKHRVSTRQPDGTWQHRYPHGWRWHVHHWRIQIPALQELRRRLLTRCAWCGGPSRKGDRVDCSHSWDGPRGRWWQGEPGLFHGDCSSIEHAHRSCVCAAPILDNDGYGHCDRCDRYRGFGASATTLAVHRIYGAVPAGQRDPEATRRVHEVVKAAAAVRDPA